MGVDGTDRVRDPVWAELVGLLDELPSTANVAFHRGKLRGTIDWPAPGPERESTLSHLRSDLYRGVEPGGLTVDAHGWSSTRRYEIRWPAAADLFSEPPPPGTAVREIVPENKVEQVRTIVVQLPDRPQKGSVKCAEHILALLEEQQRRMTAMAISDALAAKKLEWSMRSIESTLAALVVGGQLDKDRDERGRGYGLPGWQ